MRTNRLLSDCVHRLFSVSIIAGSLMFMSPACGAQDVSYGMEPADQLPESAKPYAPKFFDGLKRLTRFGLAISEDNRECYFAVALNENGRFREEIRVIKREEDGSWTEPQPLLPNEKKYKYVDPHFSPDNQRLYFISPSQSMNRKPQSDRCLISGTSSDRTKDGANRSMSVHRSAPTKPTSTLSL